MKKYTMYRIIRTVIFLIYAASILPIISGEKPYAQTNIIGYILVTIIAVGFAAFFDRKKTEKQSREEMKERDERYIKNRNTFSYYFMIALGLVIPPVIVVLRSVGNIHIQISDIALLFLIVSFIYMISIEIIRRK